MESGKLIWEQSLFIYLEFLSTLWRHWTPREYSAALRCLAIQERGELQGAIPLYADLKKDCSNFWLLCHEKFRQKATAVFHIFPERVSFHIVAYFCLKKHWLCATVLSSVHIYILKDTRLPFLPPVMWTWARLFPLLAILLSVLWIKQKLGLYQALLLQEMDFGVAELARVIL